MNMRRSSPFRTHSPIRREQVTQQPSPIKRESPFRRSTPLNFSSFGRDSPITRSARDNSINPPHRDSSPFPRPQTYRDTIPVPRDTSPFRRNDSPLRRDSPRGISLQVGRDSNARRTDSPARNSYHDSPNRPGLSSSSPTHAWGHNPVITQTTQQPSHSWGHNSIITQVSRDNPTTTTRFPPPDFLPPEPDPRTFTPLLPPKDRQMSGKNTLVLDLDETLVHSSFKPITLADHIIDIDLDGVTHQVYVRKRPFVEAFLARVCELFEVVVLTASLEVYADPVLDELDYEGFWIHHRLFRDSCANLNGNYIKDLSYLGRQLHTVIIIDNSPTSYLFQPRNALPISSWFDDPTDTELRDMLPVLERASKSDSVYPVLDQYRQSLAHGDRFN